MRDAQGLLRPWADVLAGRELLDSPASGSGFGAKMIEGVEKTSGLNKLCEFRALSWSGDQSSLGRSLPAVVGAQSGALSTGASSTADAVQHSPL